MCDSYAYKVIGYLCIMILRFCIKILFCIKIEFKYMLYSKYEYF